MRSFFLVSCASPMQLTPDIIGQMPEKLKTGWTVKGIQRDYMNIIAHCLTPTGLETDPAVLRSVLTYSEYLLDAGVPASLLDQLVTPENGGHTLDNLAIKIREMGETGSVDLAALRTLIWHQINAILGPDDTINLNNYRSVFNAAK